MRSNKIRQLSCEQMEILIAEKLSKELSVSEKSAYQHHLENCPECYNTVRVMEQMPRYLQEIQEPALKPNPQIQQHLRKRVKRQLALKKGGWAFPLDTVLDFFRLRVPVYQAALALGIFLLALLYANHLTFPGDQSNVSITASAQIADTTQILDTLETTIPENVGRNIHEDSLLARFIMIVM